MSHTSWVWLPLAIRNAAYKGVLVWTWFLQDIKSVKRSVLKGITVDRIVAFKRMSKIGKMCFSHQENPRHGIISGDATLESWPKWEPVPKIICELPERA